jgi:SagB-type dehydrogenase family enzyme
MDTHTLEDGRFFLKDLIRQQIDFSRTEQRRGLPPPPLEKPAARGARRIDLPGPQQWIDSFAPNLVKTIAQRSSIRTFTSDPLQQVDLAFLLWATQGIRKQLNEHTALRTVPSAGAQHALETYLCVNRIADLAPGIYRYLPMEHQLVEEGLQRDLPERLVEGTLGQAFAGEAAVTFVWTAVPRRMEWRYGAAAHKVIALDAGHVGQNLYLACEAIGAGTCTIAAYDQNRMDRLLGVDGREEFTVYLAPVGWKALTSSSG